MHRCQTDWVMLMNSSYPHRTARMISYKFVPHEWCYVLNVQLHNKCLVLEVSFRKRNMVKAYLKMTQSSHRSEHVTPGESPGRKSVFFVTHPNQRYLFSAGSLCFHSPALQLNNTGMFLILIGQQVSTDLLNWQLWHRFSQSEINEQY